LIALRWLGLVVPVLGSGCFTVPMAEIDSGLRDAEFRTVALEDGFTFYSAYDGKRTLELVEMIDENLEAVRRFFEMEFDGPVTVMAMPLDMERFALTTQDGSARWSGTFASPTLNGVTGYSRTLRQETPAVVFFVPRDQASRGDGSLTVMFEFDYGGTVRHELAHLCAMHIGLEGPTWFDEAIAIEAGESRLVAGELVSEELTDTIQIASRIRGRHSLADLLDWTEEGGDIAEGEAEAFQAGRPLAHAYLRFLLAHFERSPSPEAYRRILSMGREDHLALESDWILWLGAR
jgi:hypothetical protein